MARNRSRRTRALALAVCVGTLATGSLVSAGTAGAAVNTVVLKGKLAVANPSQLKVLYLPTKAPAKIAAVASNGTFSLTVPANTTGGASLQLLNNGRYLGPVTLRYANRIGFLRFKAMAASSVARNLGPIAVSLTGGYGKLATPLGVTAVDGHKVVVDTAGKPRGAGRLGLVSKMTVASASVHAAGVTPLAANPCTQGAIETNAGGDCDGDGVPNAVDVDDNGNMSLDMTDPNSAGTTAQLNPWSTLYLGMQNTLNANVAPLTAENIAATIGGENIFAVNFFIQQQSFGQNVAPDAAWINCGSIAWCNPTTGTAHVGGMSETPGFTDQAWKDYGGEDWNNGVATPLDHPAAHNGLFRMHRQQGFVWVAGVQPRSGANALTELVPGQILGLDYRVGSTTSEMPMALSPYPVTTPALKAVGAGEAAADVDYTAPEPTGSWNNPIVADSAGTVSLEFWRPQRLTLPGESGQFRDIGRLHYGMVLNAGGPEIGCSSDATTGYYNAVGPSTLHRTPETGEWAMNLWPLTDTTGDAAPNPATTLSFTIDVRQCLIDNGVTIPDEGLDVNASLTAASEMMTGGANRAVQQLRVHVDPAPS